MHMARLSYKKHEWHPFNWITVIMMMTYCSTTINTTTTTLNLE